MDKCGIWARTSVISTPPGTSYIMSVKWTRVTYLGRDRLKLAIVVFGMVLTFNPFMEWDVGCLRRWSLMGTKSLTV